MAPLLEHLPARPSQSPIEPWADELSKGYIFQAKYNGWRAIYDQQTKLAYNRHGRLSSHQRLIDERMARVKINARYIDIEIMGCRTKTGKDSIIILDAFDPNEPKSIQDRIDEFGHIPVANTSIPNGKTLRVWNIWHSNLHKVTKEMREANKLANECIFEGFVIKDINEPKYPSPKKAHYHSSGWMKYRFTEYTNA